MALLYLIMPEGLSQVRVAASKDVTPHLADKLLEWLIYGW